MTSKKLFIPIDPLSHGGGSTFIVYLLPYLKNYVTYNILDDWDIALMIGAETSIDDINNHVIPKKEKGAKILFRLNGIKHTRMPLGIERMKAMRDVSDLLIYQSKFTQSEAEGLWGVHGNSRIIYNGVDVEMFRPRIPEVHYERAFDFLYCEYSHKPHKRAQEAFALMQKIIEKYPQSTLTIIGKFPSEWVNQNFGLPQQNVKFLGRLHHNIMPTILNSHKILLFPSVDEPCSNLVLEAMASEMIIIHKNSGCMMELCEDTQVIWTHDLNCVDEAFKKIGDHEGRLRVHRYFTKERMARDYSGALKELDG